MLKARKLPKRQSKNRHKQQPVDRTATFIAHVHELRKRIFYIALSVGVFGSIAYGVEHHIVEFLLAPAEGQKFIYTSPGGGIDFLFRLCLYVGIICSIPVMVYQMLRYIEPLVKKESVHFIAWGSLASAFLAFAGVLYGYMWGLPAALKFLLNQFITQQIQPLVTIQSYLSFVMVYMVGSAMLFQIPLVLIFINRIKPIKPQRLLKYERHVIVGAVVLAALMNPTPNIIALFLLAGPIILAYQVGILIIWQTNRSRKRPARVTRLLEQDAEIRETRAQKAARLQQLQLSTAEPTVFATQAAAQPRTQSARARHMQPTRRPIANTGRAPFGDFTVARNNATQNRTLEPQSQNTA